MSMAKGMDRQEQTIATIISCNEAMEKAEQLNIADVAILQMAMLAEIAKSLAVIADHCTDADITKEQAINKLHKSGAKMKKEAENKTDAIDAIFDGFNKRYHERHPFNPNIDWNGNPINEGGRE